MAKKDFDVIIIGAGPAGLACAMALEGAGVSVAIIEKAQFPRDKICGDALSADVLKQLKLLPGNIEATVNKLTEKTPSYGVRFFAPNQQHLDIAFRKGKVDSPPGYIIKRLDFDYCLFQHVQQLEHVSIIQEQQVKNVQVTEDHALVATNSGEYTTKLLLGADGAQSIVAKRLGDFKIERQHYCAGLRSYYRNVDGFHGDNYIELHFCKDILPGYFWIFPLPNNQANVGVGMLSSTISKKKIDLKAVMQKIIDSHPTIAPRFKNATVVDEIKGFGLPIGSKKRTISGERFLLLGDAASLIDPFTGEGIGNAIRSGRVAADHIRNCFQANDFSASFNKAYDKEIYRRVWGELKISRTMQKLLKYPRLFDFVVKKANSNPSIKTLLTSALEDIDVKKELTKASFYIKLFTK